MPGHKYGRAGGCFSGAYDITEISGADNIKKPEGIIKESIENLSRIYGSKYAFYLTNGTTSGIHAVLRYAALTGGKIALSRDCHISAVNGAVLFGIEVVFIATEYKGQVPAPVKPNAVEAVLKDNPDVCMVLITSPNYYGVTAQLGKIAQITHDRGALLAVDEAHGAHFEFAGLSNISGIHKGVDIVCHSLHKTLPVYNQGAALHVCTNVVNKEIITDAVNMLGTTSPSYPLIASMERAVASFSAKKYSRYKKLKENISYFKKILYSDVLATDDYTRLVIETSVTGFDAADILHEQFAIDVEAADFNNIICIATPFNKKSDFRKLAKALASIEKTDVSRENIKIPDMPEKEIELVKAYSSSKKMIPLDMAAGCICGTIIVSYPPGTPLVCPGETIDGYAVKYIKKVINAGGSVLGIEDDKIPVLERT